MKGFKGTLLFALIVSVIAGIAVYEYKKGDKPTDTHLKSVLPTETLNKVMEINFENQQNNWSLVKKENEWHLVKPIEDLADLEEVDGFLRLVSDKKLEKVDVPDTSTPQWENFGLHAPVATFQFKTEGKSDMNLYVGGVRSYDDGFYLKKNEENDIFIADAGFESLLNKNTDDFRRKDLRLPTSAVQKIQIVSTLSGQSVDVTIHRLEEGWVFPRDKELKTNLQQIDSWLRDINRLKADGIYANKRDSERLKKFGLQTPAVTFTLTYKNEENVEFAETVNISRAKDMEMALVSSAAPAIYKIAKSKIESLVKPEREFLDRSYMFNFPSTAAQVIQLTVGGSKNFIKLERRESGWVNPTEAGKKVSQQEVKSLLSSLTAMQAEQILDGEVKGTMENKIEIKNQQDEPLFVLEFGQSSKDANGKEVYKAKTNLSKKWLAVSKSSLDNLANKNFYEISPTVETTKNNDKE